MSVTQPRIIRPGDIVLATSRVVARFFLLRPDPEMRDAFRYLLAQYAEKYGVVLYAACLMSTHWHIVFRDPHAKRPAFLRDFNRGLANFVKAHRRWEGPVFENHPSQVRLLTPGAVVDKIAYTLANPVAAGAVSNASEWPGFRSSIRAMGNSLVKAARPRKYFSANGILPTESCLRFAIPEILVEIYGESGARSLLERTAREHEIQARADVRARGAAFWGPERCRNVSPERRATHAESTGDLNPDFATKGGGPRAFREAVRELRLFRATYRDALTKWRMGMRDVAFPFGTWLMRNLYHVRCQEPEALSAI